MDPVKFQEYKSLYNQLVDTKGRVELSDSKNQEAFLQTANRYLDEFDTLQKKRETQQSINPSFLDISLSTIVKRMIQTLVDILEDVQTVILERHTLSEKRILNRLTDAIFRKERRFYVGLWIILLAFLFYFLDASM